MTKVALKKVKTIKGNKTFKWTRTGPVMHAYTGNGSCVIYVIAHNGVSKQIKLTVK